MNESRPARPPLATNICVYLIVTAVIPFQAIWIVIWGWFHSVFVNPRISLLLPHAPMPLVTCALALAGSITLWQMRRAAFFLLAGHLGFSLASTLLRLPRLIALSHRMSATLPRAVADSAMRMEFASIAAQCLLNAAIVWYVYRITSAHHFSAESAGPELTT